MAAWAAMAPTAEGKTSIRPHWRGWGGGVLVLEAMESPWDNLDHPRRSGGAFSSSLSGLPHRKGPHGQALRDLRQRTAIRTPRQSRQEPGQPEVHAQPADGARDGGWKEHACPRLHAVFEDLRRVVSLLDPLPDPLPCGERGDHRPCTSSSVARSFFRAPHTLSCTSTPGTISDGSSISAARSGRSTISAKGRVQARGTTS